jgi:hypothetical protein
VSHLEEAGAMGRRGLPMSASTLLTLFSVHLKSPLKVMVALQEMERASLRVMEQLEAVPNLELWYCVQGTLTLTASASNNPKHKAFNIQRDY